MKDGLYNAMDFIKQAGVRDIEPLKARGFFAKALAAEANAGQTTDEALAFLEEAIRVNEGE